VHSRKPVTELVTDDDAGLQGDDPAVLLRLVPHIRRALGDVDLAERERHEMTLPVGPCGDAGEHVFVGVAGERTEALARVG
jgi:hypothetical protein